ncbi:hypothetical protein N656DRAFT_783373 [Canariomyces notabilis]|uniref:DUF7053 domain-containing protein n=1 Tax=Canariomyces notabilis TaxID=2074819 RepID=A0AAN6T8F5_9PEZI|nr:hypothetical protein N656DRAFT_783373 [Canariomyces arenarius]
MLRKKDTFTVITPIPGFIPRQLAIDILHSHSEVITLNPLVLEHRPIPAPQNAETDEYYSTWYEITERIQFLPGMGRMGSSTIKFNGCFHNMPWGLQTHIYAPMNVDLRNTYRIAGNQPGVEPPEIPEIGLKALGAPSDGLYLREDIEIKCNVTVHSFVKSQMKKAGSEMVRRIIKKAELLDAGVLQAMIEDGKLKTINPADRSSTFRSPLPSPTGLGVRYSPTLGGNSPPMTAASPVMPYNVPRLQSVRRPGTAGSGYNPQPGLKGYNDQAQAVPQELPAAPNVENQMPVEMPGDFYHASADLQPARMSPRPISQSQMHRESLVDPPHSSPNPSLGGQWSAGGSRPTSYTSSVGAPDNKGFPSQLAPHQETTEEHRDAQKGDRRMPPPSNYPPYNPADYAKVVPPQPQYGHGQLPQRYNYAQ